MLLPGFGNIQAHKKFLLKQAMCEGEDLLVLVLTKVAIEFIASVFCLF